MGFVDHLPAIKNNANPGHVVAVLFKESTPAIHEVLSI